MPPSQPAEPQLLDTCVVQALDWVDELRQAERPFRWTEERLVELRERYGHNHAADLLALGSLYEEFEWLGGYPWLVSTGAQVEVGRLSGEKGRRVSSMLQFFAGHQEDWSVAAYPGVNLGTLLPARHWRPSGLVLRALGVASVDEVVADNGPLAFLPDAGDRWIARDALLANVPAILTLDVRSFWRHRERMLELGVEVWRPSHALEAYRAWWAGRDRALGSRSRKPS